MRDSALKLESNAASSLSRSVGEELMRDSALKLHPVRQPSRNERAVGEELMRDSALKQDVDLFRCQGLGVRQSEKSSCATAL